MQHYLIILLTALLSAISQILLNISARKKRSSKLKEYLNPFVISSYAILGIVLLLNIYAMQFIPLKIAHVIAASTYVFALILSRIFLKEKFTFKKVAGNILIIIGIIIFCM